MIGIYKITNEKTNKIYFGQSLNMNRRKYQHFYLLSKGIHPNPYLQKSYNKYGKNYFNFSIVEECLAEELNKREYYWVNLFNTTNKNFGYNSKIIDLEGICKLSEDTKLKMSNSQKKRIFKMSREHKDKIIQNNKSRKGNLSQKTLNKMSLSKSKVIIQYSKDNDFIQEFKSITEANIKTGISISNISNCINNKRKTAGKYKWKLKITKDEEIS